MSQNQYEENRRQGTSGEQGPAENKPEEKKSNPGVRQPGRGYQRRSRSNSSAGNKTKPAENGSGAGQPETEAAHRGQRRTGRGQNSQNTQSNQSGQNNRGSQGTQGGNRRRQGNSPRPSAQQPAAAAAAEQGVRAGVLSDRPGRSGSRRQGRGADKGRHVNIIPLGGLGEIGKNITLYEYGDDMFIVDCGMSFPDEELPGVDIVIPDLSYVVANKDKIRGLVVTHGHEDHIGAIPYLLRNVNIPIYSSNLTIGLIKGKLTEHGLADSAKLNVVKAGDKVTLGAFTVEFIHVNHSIPDAMALAITTPVGTIVQTGDFKIDTTPIDGEMIDIARLSELGKQGVLALLSDSTNVERPGFTMSESIVGETFMTFFAKAAKKRIIVATFSSNIHRIQQIIDGAVKYGRKVAVLGRSMINVVNIATELGYLKVPEGLIIDIDMIRRCTDEQLVIITTGSQGEPMSALHRMAYGDHRQVNIGPNDFIIISASPIPGNEKMVGKVINELMKLGADVMYEKSYNIHVSGHACQEELKLMLGMVHPRFFMPVHGEQKHLVKHANLACTMGMSRDNIVIPEIGRVFELTRDGIRATRTVQSGRVLVDGLGVGDVGSIVLRDRKHLSEDGILVAAMTIDPSSGELVSGPDLISRGFIFVKDSDDLIAEARELVIGIIDNSPASRRDWNGIKNRIRDELSRFFFERTKRSPMVLPIIMEA